MERYAMTEKNTPSPWQIEGKGYMAKVKNAEGHGIAQLLIDKRSAQQADDNLQLIAAAPDLLKALILCERALEERDTELEEHAAKQARAAIAKATQ
jgi:hypothetical protein